MVTREEVTSWYHVYSENIMYLIVASYQSHNIQPGYKAIVVLDMML